MVSVTAGPMQCFVVASSAERDVKAKHSVCPADCKATELVCVGAREDTRRESLEG